MKRAMRAALLLLTLVFVLALPGVALADAGGGKVSQPGNPSNPVEGSAAEEHVTVSTPADISIWVCSRERSPVLT